MSSTHNDDAHDSAAQHRHDAARHEHDNLDQQSRTALEHIVAVRRRGVDAQRAALIRHQSSVNPRMLQHLERLYNDAVCALAHAEAALAECRE